jgi:hypothetical protein
MVIENFNYPINLMIACSSQIVKGEFEDVLKAMALTLVTDTKLYNP